MDWGNFGLLALACIGHTELMVALVNRSHAQPLPCAQLKRIRHLHDLLVPLFPIVLFGGVGLTGPRLLLGGSWNDVSPFWLGYLALCSLALLGFLWTVLRHWIRRDPVQLTDVKSTITNTLKTPEQWPEISGDGPHQSLLKVPGNQVFTFELSEKTFTLAGLPIEWDGMTLWHLSDWHFTGTPGLKFYSEVTEAIASQPADMVIFSGDLLDRPDLLAWFPETLGSLTAPIGCYYILGNHDWYLDTTAVRRTFREHGWTNVAGRVIQLSILGKQLLIGGDETPWMGVPPWFSEHEDSDFRLLVSHSPDHIRRARDERVDLMLSGHTHGGQVQLPGIGPVYSPSRHGVRHASGTFFESPTLLHVSRGLGGRHPLRLRCRPEVTRITLKAKSRQTATSLSIDREGISPTEHPRT